MARNGSGTYSLPSNSFNPAVGGITISSSDWNTSAADLETAVSESIARDGQTVITADLPMASNKHTGVANAAARTDYAAAGQVQDGALMWGGTGGGTADVITIALTPVITAYAAGQCFRFISSGANTTNVTLNVNAVGADAVTKRGGTALIAGDIPADAIVEVVHDGTNFELTNIQPLITAAGAAILDDANAAAQRTTLGLAIGTDVQAWDTQLDDIAALAVTNGNFIVGDGSNWVAESGATALASLGVPFSTSFTSGELSAAADTVTDTAHSLGAVPTLVRVVLRNKTTEYGYAVGEEVDVGNDVDSNGADRGVTIASNATNVTIIHGEILRILSQATTNLVAITAANWKFVIRAWV